MALLPLPSDAKNRLSLIVNSYKNQQTGAIPQSLEDGDATNASSSMYWYNTSDQYIDVNFNQTVSIWRYPIESYSGYIGKLKIQVWNGTRFVDFPQTEAVLTSELKWTRIFTNIPRGRYKFLWESGTYRADAEWFVERGITNKILLSSGDKGFTLSRKYTDSLIPTMTSNTAPNGIASASDETLTPAFRAFDGVATSNRYWAANTKTYGWVAYDFNTPTIVARYGLTVILSNPTFAPKDWTFEGSIDGVNWTVLDRQTNQTTWINDTPNIYNMKKIGVYQKYRLNITSNNGATTVGVGEMMMYGIKHLSMRSFQNISEKIYVNYGMDEVENLTINIGEIKEHTSTNITLGSGKTYEHTIDMSKRRVDKITLG